MKKIILLIIPMWFFVSCSSYLRLGEATVVSTRNFDSSAKYEVKKRGVKVKVSAYKAKRLNVDMLTLAIEEATKQDAKGEYLQNAKIYISKSGRKLKLEADVWGGR